jgi:hypothetical protein
MSDIQIRERETYRAGGPYSFFVDVALANLRGNSTAKQAAEERLAQHRKEVLAEITQNTKRGETYLSEIRERTRSDVRSHERNFEAELRAMSSAATSGGTFETPAYLVDLWAAYRSPTASFAEEARQLTIPEYGLEVYVPSFTSTSSVAQQTTENTGVATAAPTGQYITDTFIPVITEAGYIEISQQLLDRGGFAGAGGSFDEISVLQMTQQLNAAVDQYVISQALANAGTVNEATALTTPLLWKNLATAKEQLLDTAGTRLQGTHVFGRPDMLTSGWAGYQVDSQNRPVWLADSAALLATPPAGLPITSSGWTGWHWAGNLAVFEDDNIPLVDVDQQQIIVAHMPEVFVWKGSPMVASYTQTFAGSLAVFVGLRQYIASVPHYASAVQQITGTGYANLS